MALLEQLRITACKGIFNCLPFLCVWFYGTLLSEPPCYDSIAVRSFAKVVNRHLLYSLMEGWSLRTKALIWPFVNNDHHLMNLQSLALSASLAKTVWPGTNPVSASASM